jgi:large subunit ribosomal protein L29
VSLEAKDLRGNDPDELRRTVRKLEEDLFKHKLKKTTNQLENTMLIRSTRRDIARVNTVLAERLRGMPVAPAEKAAVVFEEAEASASAAAANRAKATAKTAAANPAKATAKATKPKATAKGTEKKSAKET